MGQIKCVFSSTLKKSYSRPLYAKANGSIAKTFLLKMDCPDGVFYVDSKLEGSGTPYRSKLISPKKYGLLDDGPYYIELSDEYLSEPTSDDLKNSVTVPANSTGYVPTYDPTNNNYTPFINKTNTDINLGLSLRALDEITDNTGRKGRGGTWDDSTTNSTTSNSETTAVTSSSNILYDTLKDREVIIRANLRKANKILGMPFHFTEATDIPPFSDEAGTGNLKLGREFIENIYAEAPIVYFLPGLPSFMPDINANDRQTIDNYINDRQNGLDSSINAILGDKTIQGRYYDFVPAYAEYMKYVNLLCRMCAIYMGIGDRPVPGTSTPYKYYNWEDYQSVGYQENPETSSNPLSVIFNSISEGFDATIDALTGDYKYIKLYVDPSSSFDDSWSNSTRESMVKNLFDTISDVVKEVGFFANNEKGAASFLVNGGRDLVSSALGALDSVGNDALKAGLSSIVGSAQSVIEGANIIFPEMWGDADYSKSYSFDMKLVSPYGDPESIYLSIIVPMMHVLAMSMPRQVSANSFGSPFLVRLFARGWGSCDMGIIDSLRISKGGDGDAWTPYGMPTEVKLSIGVKDLYANLMISKGNSIRDYFLNNNGLIDFLATTCGVDCTAPNFKLKLDTLETLLGNKLFDIPANISNSIVQSVRNAVEPAFKLTR